MTIRPYHIHSARSGMQEQYNAAPGDVIVIAGPNGVGKSSLLHAVSRSFGAPPLVETLSGHRQIHFQNSDIDQIGMSSDVLLTQMFGNPQQSSRYRNAWGEQHLKSVIRRMMEVHNQDNQDYRDAVRTGVNPRDADERFINTVDLINKVFEAADLVVRLITVAGVPKAVRGDSEPYGIDRLSDGERAALLIVAAILIRPKGTIIAIDEPEKHLNPGISSPLIRAVLSLRPDLTFLLSTHDLQLVQALSPSVIVYLLGSEVTSADEIWEQRKYDYRLISGTPDVPEDVKRSILGARRPILFTEGTQASLDFPIYQSVYKERSIAPKGGWEAVDSATRTLRNNPDYSWVDAVGLVDRDGRSDKEIKSLKHDSIYVLPVPTIENLLLHPAIVLEVAKLHHGVFGGAAPSERRKLAHQAALSALHKSKDQIIAKRVSWEVNRRLAERKTSVKSIRGGQKTIELIEIEPVRVNSEQDFERLMSFGRSLRSAYRSPIADTGVLAAVAKAVGFSGPTEYRDAFVSALIRQNEAGRRIRRILVSALPKL